MRYKTPGGTYYTLFADMAAQPHLLIAGATGSGKSVIINGIITTLLVTSTPSMAGLILIDPKRVELYQYTALPHTLCYASEPGEAASALKRALTIIETRYQTMRGRGEREWSGGHVYVFIDELADLMLTERKAVMPLLQRVAQIGRAARVHLIAATQCPLAKVIPTEIKCNLDSRVGLRTRSAQDSRNILGCAGCETLPRYGRAYYMTPDGLDLKNIPYVKSDETQKLIRYWTSRACIA